MVTSCRDGAANARAHDTFLKFWVASRSRLRTAEPPAPPPAAAAEPPPRRRLLRLLRHRRRHRVAAPVLFTVLAVTVSLAKAGALAGGAAVVFGAAGCVSRCCAGGGGAGPAALPTTVAPPARGLVDAAIDALPEFAYARPGACGAEGGGGGGGSKSGRCALCPVCLEDVEAGEMVRQLPACRHLFHVECVDMWLHSHATCPLCRCQVSPQQVGVKLTAAADPPDGAPPV